MISNVNRNIIIATVVLGLILFFVDVIFDSVLWVLHIGFEILEFSLDQSVEYLFQTEHHESEVIGIYILLALTLVVLYRVLGRIIKSFLLSREKLSYYWQRIKTNISVYWHKLTLLEKIKLVLVTTTCITTLLFFLTL